MTEQHPDAPQDRPAGAVRRRWHPGGGMPVPPPAGRTRVPRTAPRRPGSSPAAPRPPGVRARAPPYGVVPTRASEARMWSVFAQLGGTFLSFLVPLVIYLVFKDRDPFVRRHSLDGAQLPPHAGDRLPGLCGPDAGPDRLPARRAAWVMALVFTDHGRRSPRATAGTTSTRCRSRSCTGIRRLPTQVTPSSRRTTASASSRPCLVSTTRRCAGRPRSTSPSAIRPATAGRRPAAARPRRSPSTQPRPRAARRSIAPRLVGRAPRGPRAGAEPAASRVGVGAAGA